MLKISLIILYFSVVNSYNDDSLFIIRSAVSRFVVEGGPVNVTLQEFDGFKPQLWQFQKGKTPGIYIIVNNSTGTALDGRGDTYVKLAEKTGSPNQEWYISFDGRIVNSGAKLNLDISDGRFAAGVVLGLVSTTKGVYNAQRFNIKEKPTCG